MTLAADQVVAVAAELREAERSANPIELLTGRFAGFTFDDARRVARARDELRLGDGDVLIGYKLGWTSAAMRDALGIERPNWGTLWRSQVVSTTVTHERFIHPKVEPELVWRCPDDLAGELGAATVLASGGQWAVGLEIVDPRWPSYSFDWLDNTADNSSAGAIVISEFATLDAPESIEIEFSDGHETRRGVGANAMGSPAEAVSWLCRQLALEGTGLRAGDIVFYRRVVRALRPDARPDHLGHRRSHRHHRIDPRPIAMKAHYREKRP